jgi:F0F1-type ATP synthase assembly protein I
MSDPTPHDVPDEQPKQSGVSDLPGAAAFAVMGTTIASCEAVGVGLGIWADRTWGTAPGGLIIGVVLGTVAAVVSVVQQVRRFL